MKPKEMSIIVFAVAMVVLMVFSALPGNIKAAQVKGREGPTDNILPTQAELMEKFREFTSTQKNSPIDEPSYALRTADNDNDIDNATALTLDVTDQTGDVSFIQGDDDDRQDFYKFDMTRGDAVTVSASSSNEWHDSSNKYFTFIMVVIYNPDKFSVSTELASSSFIQKPFPDYQVGAAVTGTYYLEVLPYLYSTQAQGFVQIYGKATYKFSLTKSTGHEGDMDTNNRPSEAVDASSGVSGSYDINASWDQLDFYSLGNITVSGTNSKKVDVTMTPDAHGHVSCSLIIQMDSDYGSVFSSAPPDGNYSMNHPEEMHFTIERTGVYYIMVSAGQTDETHAPYDLSIAIADATTDGDGYYDTAQVITMTNHQYSHNDSVDHSSPQSSNDYHDYYRIDNVPTGWNLSATLTMSNPYDQNNNPNGQDYDLYIIDSSKKLIAYGATVNNPEVAWKVLDNGGTFYIMIEAYAGTGSYTLDVKMVNPNAVPPQISNAQATPTDVPADGQTPFTVTAAVSDSDGTVESVTLDLSSVGGSSTTPMVDDGSGADVTAADGVYTGTGTVAPGTTLGQTNVVVKAVDNDGAESSANVPVNVLRWNHAPKVAATAVSTYSIDEDTTDEGLDLSTVFTDEDGDPLTYSWASTTPDDHHLSIIISNTGKVTLTPDKDWNGNEKIQFKAEDTDHASVSHNITITVNPVNDPPKIDKINILSTGKITTPDGKTFTTNEKEWFNFTMIGADVDLDYEGDTLTWDIDLGGAFAGLTSYNTEQDPIHQEKFNVSMKPRQEDVGEHPITVTLTDNAGAKDTVSFTISVQNVNDPPVITSIEDDKGNSYPVTEGGDPIEFTVKENDWLNLTVIAEDPDPGDSDYLRYSTDSSYVEFTSTTDNTISFHPTSNMIGTYDVTLKVKDQNFAEGIAKIKITVENKNDPPTAVIASPEDGDEFTTDDNITFDATGSDVGGNDADYGDTLTYVWYMNGKPIPGGDKKTFTYKFDKAGDYVIKLEVEDGGDNGVNKLSDSTEINIKVKEASSGGSGTGGGGSSTGGGSAVAPSDPSAPTTVSILITVTQATISYKDNGATYTVTYSVEGKVTGTNIDRILVMTYSGSTWSPIKNSGGDIIVVKPGSDGSFKYSTSISVPKSSFNKGATQLAVVAYNSNGGWNSNIRTVTPKESSGSSSTSPSGSLDNMWIYVGIGIFLLLIIILIIVLVVVKKKSKKDKYDEGYQEGIAPAGTDNMPVDKQAAGYDQGQQAVGYEQGQQQYDEYGQPVAAAPEGQYDQAQQAVGYEQGQQQYDEYGQPIAAAPEGQYDQGSYQQGAGAAQDTTGVPAVQEGAGPTAQQTYQQPQQQTYQQPEEVQQQTYQQPQQQAYQQQQPQQYSPEVQAEIARKQQMIQQQMYQQQGAYQQQQGGYGTYGQQPQAATGRCPYCGAPVQPGWFICPNCRRPLQ